LKLLISELEKRDKNCRKSPNTNFKREFLLQKRKKTVDQKIECLKIIRQLSKNDRKNEDIQRLREKQNIIFVYTTRILTFIGSRVQRERSDEYFLENFEEFLYIILTESGPNMSEFSYSDAKHLPELKTVGSDNTSIRDFLAAVTAYHEELSPAGRVRLITFVKSANILGAVKTKLGDGDDIATLVQLKSQLYSKCGTKESYESLKEKIEQIKMKGSLEDLASELTELTNRLVALEVLRLGPGSSESISKMMQRDALRVFKKENPRESQGSGRGCTTGSDRRCINCCISRDGRGTSPGGNSIVHRNNQEDRDQGQMLPL
jgi:prefoldin subunit 5